MVLKGEGNFLHKDPATIKLHWTERSACLDQRIITALIMLSLSAVTKTTHDSGPNISLFPSLRTPVFYRPFSIKWMETLI